MIEGLVGLIALVVSAIGFLLIEFGGLAIVWLIGALVGVLYPPKSPTWARWQRVGMALGGIAVAAFGLAGAAAVLFDGSPFVPPCLVLGAVALFAYAVIGNVCRSYHEGTRPANPSSCDQRPSAK